MANSPLSSLDAAAKFLLMTDVKNISLEGQRAKCGQSGKKRVSSLRVLQLQRLHKNNDNDTIIIIIIISIIIIQLWSIIITIIIIINTRESLKLPSDLKWSRKQLCWEQLELRKVFSILGLKPKDSFGALGTCCCLLSGNESLLSLKFYTITKMLTIIFTGSKKTHQCKKQINKQLKHNIL